MSRTDAAREQPAWSWADRVHVLQWARPVWVWWLVFLIIATMYVSRLDAWLINDDEGSYLYAAWRISLGEMPYRDFLTPQLPGFLFPGGLLMKLVGPSVWHARLLASALTLCTGIWTWAVARRLFGGWVAVVAGAITLLHPLVFTDYRTYRSDPFMLFFATLGLLLFARAVLPRPRSVDPPDRRWLALSGAVFGLATLSKLFAPLVAVGCVAWLLAEAWRRRRPVGAVVADVLAFGLPATAVVGLAGLAFVLLTPGVLDAVVGHHLRQGSGQGLVPTVTKGLRFYTEFLRYDNNALLAVVAMAMAVAGGALGDRRAKLFAWQLPTALAFLLLSRQLFVRHMIYLVPAMAVLFGMAAVWLGEEVRHRFRPMRDVGTWRAMLADRPTLVALALVAGLVVPWLVNNWHRSWETEYGTERVGDVIGLLSEPGDLVLSDYSELNFYGKRPSTYSGASFSEGAARSGQISWNLPESPHRIKDELDGELPPLLVLDSSEEFAHLRFLHDYDDFAAWVAEGFEPLGTIQRHHQSYDVMVPSGEAAFTVRFDNGLELLSAGLMRSAAEQGEDVQVRTAWRADGATDVPAAMSVRLVDGAGQEWAAADMSLHASGAGDTGVRTTDAWGANELSAERTTLEVPPGTPPGEYLVTLGLYRTDNLERLEAMDESLVGVGQSVPIGHLVVHADAGASAALPSGVETGMAHASVGNLTLMGHGPVPTGPITSGTTFPLELWWRADGPIAEDLSTRVTLDDPRLGALAADWSETLGVPGFGSSTWSNEGLLTKQVVRVPVLADAAGGSYRLGVTPVGLDGTPYGRPDGDAEPPIDIGTVEVVARDMTSIVTDAPDVAWPLDAVLGDVAQLLGVNTLPGSMPGVAQPGEPLGLELVWRAQTVSPTGYKVTVQLVDREGTVLAQHDGEPADWARPTTGWIPGEIVLDPHVLNIPPDAPAGQYRLLVGMYHPLTMTRLAVDGKDGAGDFVLVHEVQVPEQGTGR